MGNADRLTELQLRAEAGLITEAESAERIELLLNDPAAFEEYVNDLHLQASLTWRLSGLQQSSDCFDQELVGVDADASSAAEDSSAWDMVVDQALAMRRLHEIEDEANRQLAAQQAEDARHRRFELRRRAGQKSKPDPSKLTLALPLLIGGLAAMLFLAVFLLLPSDGATPTDAPVAVNPPTNAGRTARTTPDRPTATVARLRQTHQLRWADTPGTVRPDADGRMSPGRYALASGAVELRLDGGAVLLVEAPAEFELIDNNTGRLLAGQLSIDTTDAASGFRLQTPTAEMRDFNTSGSAGRFGVAVAPSGATSAHVYAGRMDFASLAPTGVGQAITLTTKQGAVVDRADAQPELAPVAAEQFALEMAVLSAKPVVTGEADYFNHMPASVVMNRGPQSPRAWVALESTGRPLMRGTAWAQSYPSDPSVLIDPEGRVVDSYLVVFDPADETPGRFHTVEFTLTFPSEVMTIITQNQDLAQSHGWYGTEVTRYEELDQAVDGLDPGVADGDAAIESADSVSLSDDGRTLRVSIRVAPAGADAFRVLVVRPARTGQAPPLPGRTQALFFRGTADAVSPKSFTPHRHFLTCGICRT